MSCRKYKQDFKEVLKKIINQYGNLNCRTFMTIIKRLKEEIRRGNVYKNKGDILFLITEIEKYSKLDTFLYNTILNLCSNNTRFYGIHIKPIYKKMEKEGIEIDTITCNTYMKALDNMNDFEGVKRIYEKMEKEGIEIDTITCNTYMKALANMNDCDGVKRIYKKMEKEGMISVKLKRKGGIDIHGMQQIDLKQFMETNFDIIKRTKQYKIICGRGNHSENVPVLKKVIIEFCKSNKLKFKADSNGGRIIINP